MVSLECTSAWRWRPQEAEAGSQAGLPRDQGANCSRPGRAGLSYPLERDGRERVDEHPGPMLRGLGGHGKTFGLKVLHWVALGEPI